MNVGRPTIAALAVFTSIGLTGCAAKSHSNGTTAAPAASASPGGITGSGAASTSPTGATSTGLADPAAELEAAVSKLANTPLKLKVAQVKGVSMQGAFDLPGQRFDVTTQLGATGSMQMRQLGTDLYVKVTGTLASALGSSAMKWMHVDTTKLAASSPLNLKNNDPQATAKMLSASASVHKTSDHAFAGTLDLTKSPKANMAELKMLGNKATAVPFTAKTDDQGRLTELVLDMNALAPSAGKLTTDYSDFGAPVAVQVPPAATVIEMPASFGKLLGV